MEILRAKNQFNETVLSFYIDYEKQEATLIWGQKGWGFHTDRKVSKKEILRQAENLRAAGFKIIEE